MAPNSQTLECNTYLWELLQLRFSLKSKAKHVPLLLWNPRCFCDNSSCQCSKTYSWNSGSAGGGQNRNVQHILFRVLQLTILKSLPGSEMQAEFAVDLVQLLF
ncbi:unnamed protein product [Ceratitis capitata]|uniref:(Mediterranean fruit fly) hypothetical protein n=1 Tax=Ceratitis capitata TaxID=7213 RepID=A0A811V0U7_CERCA|nr:unnamed protein product [Ceratitis capitata]